MSDAVAGPSVAAVIDAVGVCSGVLFVDAEPFPVPGDPEARRCRALPNIQVASGTYAFGDSSGWRLVVVRSEEGQTTQTAFQHDLVPGSALWPALMTLGARWDEAELIGAGTAGFAPGDGVLLVGGDSVGTVISAAGDGTGGWQYRVRFADGVRNVPESGLLPLPDDDAPAEWTALPVATVEEVRLLIALTKLSRPLSDVVYAFGATRTVFRPYQFKPLLKLLQTNSQRLLIADEVGLGKTIEAGLIWTELHQRAGVRRGLVVCPAALTRKWRAEMKRRFDVELEIINRSRLAEFADELHTGEDPALLAAISLESFRTARELDQLAELEPRFDLIVVDEAHALRNRSTRSFALGELLSDWSDVLLFLSATPLNLGTDDLFNLLNLLAGETFPDQATFADQLAPNAVLNNALRQMGADPSTFQPTRRALAELGTVPLGRPLEARPQMVELQSRLSSDQPLTPAELAGFRRTLLEMNTLSSIVTRTRKADVPDAKATRVAETIDVDWTDEEHAFYFAVLHWARERAIANNGIVGFATIMPLRQAASSLPAMRMLLDESYGIGVDDDDLDDDPWSDLDAADASLDDDVFSAEALATMALKAAATAVGTTDTKYDQFAAHLRQLRAAGFQQVMVFSFFRRTLSYLRRRLSETYSVRVMDGSVPPPMRAQIMEDYRNGDFDILLLSEVGSEGLDFEFVGALVNYDLPWNPMRVEQRIGRLDRFGQTHERIHIANFHVPGTIETDIFERLYTRIRVFEESIGELEPILRNQMTDITRLVLDPRRSDAERQREIDRIALAVENKQSDLEDLQERSPGLMTSLDEILIDGFDEQMRSSGKYIGPAEVQLLVERLVTDCGAMLKPPTKGPVWEIRGSVELERQLVAMARSNRNRRIEDLASRLRAAESMWVVFDSESAIGVSADLVVAGHPLTTAAVTYASQLDLRALRRGSIQMSDGPTGRFAVLLTLVEATGARPSRELTSVAINLDTHEPVDGIGEAVLAAAAVGNLTAETSVGISAQLVDQLDGLMRERRDEIERERRATNEADIDARAATLEQTYGYKIRRAEETLATVRERRREERVQRIYTGRIANLQARLAADLDALASKRELTVTWKPVALLEVATGSQ